jgi:phosphoglycerate dehydrogenase-like enzyme
MKVLVADQFEQAGIDALQQAGCDVVYQPDLKDDALAKRIPEVAAEVLIVRSTTVTGSMLDAGSLSLVVRAGAGYNFWRTCSSSCAPATSTCRRRRT